MSANSFHILTPPASEAEQCALSQSTLKLEEWKFWHDRLNEFQAEDELLCFEVDIDLQPLHLQVLADIGDRPLPNLEFVEQFFFDLDTKC